MSIIEEKMHSFKLTKRSPKPPTVFADACNQARLLISHPADGVTWKIDCPDEVPGFWHLSASVPIGVDYYTERMEYQRFELVLLADKEFQRIQ